jgi:hypothetical protein
MHRALWVFLALAVAAACARFTTPTVDPQLVAWQAQATALRGHAFVSPVQLAWISRDDVSEVIRGELAGVVTAEEIRVYRDGYAALGVFPPGLDYVDALLALQTDVLAGLYSRRTKTLYVLDSLRDDPDGVAPEQSQIVVHELVHALQDQHFPASLGLLQGLRHQDDVVAALSAVIEGDAAFTELGLATLDDGSDARTLRNATRIQQGIFGELENPESTLAKAPRLLRESLFFPYAWGPPRSAALFEARGNAGLDDALREPPLSTLRIFTPDDTDPVEFIRLPIAELVARMPAERQCVAGHDNVAGALTLRVLFDEYGPDGQGAELMRGWSGDRFVQLDCGRTWELGWLTRWDSPAAAARFADAYRAIAKRVAANAPLSGVPQVVARDRAVLVVTPGVTEHADWLFAASEIRAYSTFVQWRDDGCFPETPCPDAGAN